MQIEIRRLQEWRGVERADGLGHQDARQDARNLMTSQVVAAVIHSSSWRSRRCR